FGASDAHEIHIVRSRGYVAAPVLGRSIQHSLKPSDIFDEVVPQAFPVKHIEAVHDSNLVEYLKRASAAVEPGKSIYPYVFPIRNRGRPPQDLPLRAGYYCIDTFTPINVNAYAAALRAVDCAMTGAKHLLDGGRLAY